jgi:hypothetical protein
MRVIDKIFLGAAAAALVVFIACNKPNPQTATTNSTTAPAEPQTGAMPPPPPPVAIPAGQMLTVTLNQAVGTTVDKEGDHFYGSLALPVVVNGTTVLPVGTAAVGVVVRSDKAGSANQDAQLALEIDYVTLNGQRYQVQTEEFGDAGRGQGARIAAVSGNAMTAVSFSSRRDIHLAAGQRLHFRLQRQVTIRG